jgi:hypothetical protein
MPPPAQARPRFSLREGLIPPGAGRLWFAIAVTVQGKDDRRAWHLARHPEARVEGGRHW